MIKIKLMACFDNELYISKETRDKYQISGNRMSVHYGEWNRNMKIIIDEQLSDQTIGLPKSLKELYTIATDLPYEIVVDDGKIIIGPVIAYVAMKSKKKLKKKSLRRFKPSFDRYHDINGLIYICAADSIHVKNKTVEGFYYNPHATDENDQWIYGTFPYPGAMYKRVALPDLVSEDLQNSIQGKIFNLNYFNKWQLYKTVSSNDHTKQFIPETRELKSFTDIEEMIEKHNTVYLKPIAGSKGKGILSITKTKKGLKVFDRKKKQLQLTSKQQSKKFFNRFVRKKEYLVQQGVPTTFQNQHVDFRLYMQKNASKEWICQGIVGRFAKKQSIITNIKFTEYLLPGHDAIEKLFKVDSNEASEITDKMVSVGIDISRLVDKEIGHFGDFAIDMIIDKNGNVWILEINNRIYGTKSLKLLKDYERLTTIKTTPFEYAKALAGFHLK